MQEMILVEVCMQHTLRLYLFPLDINPVDACYLVTMDFSFGTLTYDNNAVSVWKCGWSDYARDGHVVFPE